MGYHSGMLVARTTWPALEDKLRARAKIDLGREVTAVDDLDRNCNLAGEYDGRAYVYDGEMMVSAEGDLIAELSRDLDTLVIGCGAETVSGSYWLFAAERGELRRVYWACAMSLARPLDDGAWPAGDRIELEDLDGEGIRTVLERAGFDFDGFIERGTKSILTLADDFAPASGPIAARIAAHRGVHEIPDSERPRPRLVVRTPDGGAIDLAPGAARPSLWQRIGRWFSRS